MLRESRALSKLPLLMDSLDNIGIRRGTDKSSPRHDYLEHYERFFDAWREDFFTLVEIGVYNGASLETWRDFFPNAQIVGVDIAPRSRRYAGERTAIEIGSQADGDFLDGLMRRHRPRVIIDDGSHQPEHQIFTFERVFPLMQPGGCYIVEDVAAVSYFSRITERLISGTEHLAARVESLPRAIALWKVTAPRVTDLGEREMLALQSTRAESLLYLAEFLATHGAFDRALAIVDEAIKREPANPWFHHRASVIHHRRGNHQAALTAATRAVELKPKQTVFSEWLTELRRAS